MARHVASSPSAALPAPPSQCQHCANPKQSVTKRLVKSCDVTKQVYLRGVL
jgi:hypothetical protein